ncbi:MAG: PEGA domain-containing protein [Planctomycetes bacterium]|nr:PEGA domain-containing protein [Planctomycetota bacterium]
MSASTSSKLLALALAAACGGCSLVTQGTSQEVEFSSEPPGATFTVAGKTETTPAKFPVPKDDYVITFQREGYKDVEFELRRKLNPWFYGSIAMGVIASTVDIATGAWKEFNTTDVRVVLDPLPGRIQELPVSVTSVPPGADIIIEKVSYGRTPREFQLPWRTDEREKKIELRLAGYEPATAALLRSEKMLQRTLEPLPVPVVHQIASKPEKAELRVDGRLVGKTPLPVELTWKTGDKPRTVEWSLEGYRSEKREISRESKDLSVDLQETVEEIVLPLKIEPAGAKVVIDGVALPDGAKQAKLAWSVSKTTHRVTLSQPGYATKTVEVKRADAAKPLEVRLAPAIP